MIFWQPHVEDTINQQTIRLLVFRASKKFVHLYDLQNQMFLNYNSSLTKDVRSLSDLCKTQQQKVYKEKLRQAGEGG